MKRPGMPVFAMMLLGLSACGGDGTELDAIDVGAHGGLAAHTAEFEQRVYEVTGGVYVAVGYGLANSILIEGDDGVIIVDTMESREAAHSVKDEFDKITRKPVVAMVYTHNHADHIFGARVFAGDENPAVYAHETTTYYIDRLINVIRPAIYSRSMRMFGNYLPEGGVLNAGIGPALNAGHGGGTPGLIRPTHTFSDELELEISGVKMKLVHAPGETNDQILVWLGEKRVVLPGDNFYKAFPNLYTIRGTPYRDVLTWAKSIDKIRALNPEYLVPSHTRPISGSTRISEILTDYRDAIQYVHDQTIRGINRGLEPDELVEFVRLPPHLANSPYLQEYYGTIEWAVRAIFAGYLGWFGGDSAYLSSLTPAERARRLAALAESDAPLLEQTRRAVSDGDYQWAVELASNLMRVDPDLEEARLLKAQALMKLGERHRSANGRNFYMTQALELRGEITIGAQDLSKLPDDFLGSLPISGIIEAMSVNLNAAKSLKTDRIVGFRFPDVGEAYTVHVRRGVAEIQPVFPESPEIAVTVDSQTWKEIVMGRRNLLLALASGEVEVEGSKRELLSFLRLFERPVASSS